MSGWPALAPACRAARALHGEALAAPRAAQDTTLAAVLNALSGSTFASDHGLHANMDRTAFRKAIPVRNYNDFDPWFTALTGGNLQALTGAAPVAFELTGGSSGGRKPVPLSAALLRGFEIGVTAWLGDLAMAYPGITQGRAYFAISPALRHSPNPIAGLPVGLPNDLAYFGALAADIAPLLLMTGEIAALQDLASWRNATLALLAGAPDFAFASVWSPTFLTALLDQWIAAPDPVLQMIAEGGAGLAPNPERARQIEKDGFSVETLWPNLALVSAWADASAAPGFNALQAALPQAQHQGKGLLATEGLFTLPLAAYPDPVPAILSGLLEFEAHDGTVLWPEDIAEGDTYAVIVTPIGGLPRYRIGDLVRCTGWAMPGVPMLRFVGRESGSDLVGEKLTEAFVLACLTRIGLSATLAARRNPARYDVITADPILPATLTQLETELSRNP